MLDTLSEDTRHALEVRWEERSPSTFSHTTPRPTASDGSRRATRPTRVTAASRSSSTRSSRAQSPRGPSDVAKSAMGSCVPPRGAPGDGRHL